MPIENLCQSVLEFVGYQKISYLFVIIAQTMFVLAFIYANQHKLHPIQSGLSRGIAAVLFNFTILKILRLPMTFKNPKTFIILFLRSEFVILHFLLYALSQYYITQPVLQTINSCGPIFIFVLDYLINGITITRKQAIGVCLAIIGVLLAINGGHILQMVTEQQEFYSKFDNYATSDYEAKIFVSFCLLVGVLFWAYGQILVKNIQNLEAIQINLYFSLVLTLTNAILYPLLVTDPVQAQVFYVSIGACGIPIAISALFFITALKINKNSGMTTMFVFSSVIVGYFISILRYDQQINSICVVGSLLIAISLGQILIKDQKQQKQQKQ